MARCFDNEISDASFEADRRFDRDAEREPARLPRYPAAPPRRLVLQARFADLLSGSVKPDGES